MSTTLKSIPATVAPDRSATQRARKVSEPCFLSLEQIEKIHERSLASYGGLAGARDPGGLEAAAMHPRNVFFYEAGDLIEIAAAYAFHIAEAQAYLDGNKRTAAASALIFLKANGVPIDGIDPMALYAPMIAAAAHELDRQSFAAKLRELFS